MPRGDGTGPGGLGPMTGRAAGYCAGYSVPGYMNPTPGGGYFGRANLGRGGFGGRGRGYRNWFYATGVPGWQRAQMGLPAFGGAAAGGYVNPAYYAAPMGEMTPQEEARMLKEQSKAIQQELSTIDERIKELETLSKKTKKE